MNSTMQITSWHHEHTAEATTLFVQNYHQQPLLVPALPDVMTADEEVAARLEHPLAFLAQRGWEATLTQGGATDAHYGRWPYPVIPITMPNMPHNWFVTARYNRNHNFG